MSKRRKKCRRHKCKCCHKWFMPNRYNAWHQRYCSEPLCQVVSHRNSQKRYDRKHPDRYQGDVRRVQNWRAERPFYWRHTPPIDRFVFLITHKKQPSECLDLRFERFDGRALRDVFSMQLNCGKSFTHRFRIALHNLIIHTPFEWYFYGCSRQKALVAASTQVSRGPPTLKACRRKA